MKKIIISIIALISIIIILDYANTKQENETLKSTCIKHEDNLYITNERQTIQTYKQCLYISE